MHADEPKLEKVPARQPEQTDDVDALDTVENVPAGQPVHAIAPTLNEKYPAGHDEHTDEPELIENEPSRQPEHTDEVDALDTTENVPAGQLVHEFTPPLEYVPVKHEMQAAAATSP